MNVDELMKLDRPLTDEEADFMEQQVLLLAKELQRMMGELSLEVEKKDPKLAAEMRRPPARMVQAIQNAMEIPRDQPESLKRLNELVKAGDIAGALDSVADRDVDCDHN
jgi:hypothetical protein